MGQLTAWSAPTGAASWSVFVDKESTWIRAHCPDAACIDAVMDTLSAPAQVSSERPSLSEAERVLFRDHPYGHGFAARAPLPVGVLDAVHARGWTRGNIAVGLLTDDPSLEDVLDDRLAAIPPGGRPDTPLPSLLDPPDEVFTADRPGSFDGWAWEGSTSWEIDAWFAVHLGDPTFLERPARRVVHVVVPRDTTPLAVEDARKLVLQQLDQRFSDPSWALRDALFTQLDGRPTWSDRRLHLEKADPDVLNELENRVLARRSVQLHRPVEETPAPDVSPVDDEESPHEAPAPSPDPAHGL